MKKRPEGLGFWTAYASMMLAKYGTWRDIARATKAVGGSWVAYRTTDPAFNGLALEAAISAFHAEGIAFYGWHYSYPTLERVSTQVAHMVRCQNAGADGHLVNAEIEFTTKRGEATRLGDAIRKALPEWYVAHAPLGWIDFHPTWPYEEFDAWTDDVHPQMYWSELRFGDYSKAFRAQIERWRAGLRHGTPHDIQGVELATGQRVCPIGVTYGKGDLVGTKQPPGVLKLEDVKSFLEVDVAVMPCFSLYSLEVATPAVLEYLRSEWSWSPPPAAA